MSTRVTNVKMPQCVFKSCKNNARKNNLAAGVSYFRFPSNPFTCAEWTSIVARERRDVFYRPAKNTYICSDHFDKCDISGNTHRRRLLKTAVPKLQIQPSPVNPQLAAPSVSDIEVQEELASTSQHYSEYGTTQSGEEYHHLDQNKEQSDDSRSSWADTPITVKVEVDEEDEFDGDDHPEKRKRTLDEDPIGVLYTKKLKLELDPLQSIQPQCSTVESPQVPSKRAVPPAPPKPKPQKSQDSQFLVVSRSPAQNSRLEHTQTQKEEPTTQQLMSVVEQNQKEILKLLKEQTLLQDPDPELHMFLKLLGAKLQRLQKKKQHEIQSKIMELLSLE